MKLLHILLLIYILNITSAEKLQITEKQYLNSHIKTTTLKVKKIQDKLVFNGLLVTDKRKTYRVSPFTDGVVTKIFKISHDEVKKGQVLATIRSKSLGQAQARYLEDLAIFKLAESERKRIKKLWKDGVLAESRWLKIDSEYQKSQASLDSRLRFLVLAGLTDEQIKGIIDGTSKLSEFSLVSPIDGLITKMKIETGQQLLSGQMAYQIDDLSTVWAQVNVPITQLQKIELDSNANIDVKAYPTTSFSGKLESFDSFVATKNQTIKGRVIVVNRDKSLLPGMHARITLNGKLKMALSVPKRSVFQVGDQDYVFQVLDKTTYMLLPITTTEIIGSEVVVSAGVNEGIVVVSSGVAELKSHWQYQGGE